MSGGWRDGLREDVEAYAAEQRMPVSRLWKVLSMTPDAMTDEEVALYDEFMDWWERRYGV